MLNSESLRREKFRIRWDVIKMILCPMPDPFDSCSLDSCQNAFFIIVILIVFASTQDFLAGRLENQRMFILGSIGAFDVAKRRIGIDHTGLD